MQGTGFLSPASGEGKGACTSQQIIVGSSRGQATRGWAWLKRIEKRTSRGWDKQGWAWLQRKL
eukprot:1149729-Pelagomonas_calceolata.AAC.2